VPALINLIRVLGTVLHPLLLSQWLILLAVATSTIENSPLSIKLRYTPENKTPTILIKEDKRYTPENKALTILIKEDKKQERRNVCTSTDNLYVPTIVAPTVPQKTPYKTH